MSNASFLKFEKMFTVCCNRLLSKHLSYLSLLSVCGIVNGNLHNASYFESTKWNCFDRNVSFEQHFRKWNSQNTQHGHLSITLKRDPPRVDKESPLWLNFFSLISPRISLHVIKLYWHQANKQFPWTEFATAYLQCKRDNVRRRRGQFTIREASLTERGWFINKLQFA